MQMKCWREYSSKEGRIYKKEPVSANDDLSDYFSQQDQIEALKKEVDRLNARLKSEVKAKSKWKCKYEKIKPERKSIRTKKNQRAIDLIAARENGDLTYSLADIGRMLEIRYGMLKNMAYTYRQCIKN